MTSKLSRKDKKFPSTLTTTIYSTNFFNLIIVFILQKTESSLSFRKICFLFKLLLDYYSSIANIFYFISVIFIYFIVQKENLKKTEIENLNTKISTIMSIIIYLFIFSLICVTYLFKIDLKFCFLGACLENSDLYYSLQIFPYKIESFILFSIIAIFLFFQLFKNKSEFPKNENYHNQSENEERIIDDCEDQHKEKVIFNIQKEIKEKNIIFNNIFKVLIFEISYFLLITFDAYLKYFKFKYFQLSRYEDYCSIHDYIIIIKSLLIFFILVATKNNLGVWKKAFYFYDDKIIEDSDKIENIVDEVFYLKSKIENMNNKISNNK